MIVPARRRHPRTFNYRITRRGGMMGYSGYSGLGDCTPTSCPDGPYPGNDSANYDYFLNQTSTPDQQKAGYVIQDIPTSAVQSVLENSVAPTPKASYYDLIASAGGFRTCDPRDSACTLYNAQLQTAVENYWVSHNMDVPAGTKINFSPNLSASAMQAYMGTPGTLQSGNMITPGTFQVVVPTPTYGTPGPGPGAAANKQTGGGGGGGTSPPGTQNLGPAPNVDLTGGGTGGGSSSSSSSGFDLSSIPWWGWAAAAGVAFFALGGKH